MFCAALVASEAPPEQKQLARRFIAKARKYNEFRNILAHDLPCYDYKGGVILVDGKAQFQSDEIKEEATKKAVTMEHLRIAAGNFEALAKVMMDAWHEIACSKTPSLDKYHERIHQLPLQAHTKDQAAPKKPRQQRLPLASPKKAPKA